MDFQAMWQAVLGELEVNISRASFATWFKHTEIVANEEGHVVVATPNIFNKEWLEQKYQKDIKAALQKLNGGIRGVEFRVTSNQPRSAHPTKSIDDIRVVPTPSTQLDLSRARACNLNAKYTFDNFVVGSSNELAYATSKAVVAKPGSKYNPLFIYGGTGLGKTHLIQAVGNEILRADPNKKVEYVI